uniref:G-protein coupled receptors family 1 profile domain-containing protein n=1 Tax=Anopheles culicifacies TaxID=139723 RepID=A0A182M4R5_9DIPT
MDELINGTLQHLPYEADGRWSNATSVLPTLGTFAEVRDDSDFPDETSRFSRPLLTFAAITTITIMITGIVGNLLTIVALLRCPKVRNVAAAFIISLCIADCLFCIIVLPFNAMRFIQGTWMHGETLCTLITFMQYGSVGVSLLCITMISINRYIMIAHYSIYPKVYKTSWIMVMIIACWLFSYGFQLPTLFGVWGKFGYNHQLGTCSILPDDEGRSSKTAMFIIAFIIPCIIIVICYSRIFCVVHNSANNNSISYTASSSAVKVAGTRSAADARDAKARRNEWRITKMVLAIFLSFVFCYLPITISKIVDKNVSYPVLHIIGYIMLYLSACMNPIIYVIMNKQYRQAYKTVIFCKPSRLLGFGGSSVGEKWKDIGYSYNHSRTMVSQVSIAEPESPPSSRLRQDSPHPQHLVAIQDS